MISVHQDVLKSIIYLYTQVFTTSLSFRLFWKKIWNICVKLYVNTSLVSWVWEQTLNSLCYTFSMELMVWMVAVDQRVVIFSSLLEERSKIFCIQPISIYMTMQVQLAISSIKGNVWKICLKENVWKICFNVDDWGSLIENVYLLLKISFPQWLVWIQTRQSTVDWPNATECMITHV